MIERIDLDLLDEVADYYCDEILMINSKYALSTRELYSDAYKTHIQGSKLCSKPLYTVRGEDVQILYNQLAITKSALATTHKFMVGFFKWAANNKLDRLKPFGINGLLLFWNFLTLPSISQ